MLAYTANFATKDLTWYVCFVFCSTVIQLRQACCHVLVDEHADQICEDAETFLINNQKEDLHRLFSLFSELTNEKALMSFKVVTFSESW